MQKTKTCIRFLFDYSDVSCKIRGELIDIEINRNTNFDYETQVVTAIDIAYIRYYKGGNTC